MSKFAKTATTARPTGVTGTIELDTHTYEGQPAYSLDTKTELFTLAVNSMFAGSSFYETEAARSGRFVDLVRKVTYGDPDWMAQFIPWLRREANMRTASVIAAVEYARNVPHAEVEMSGREMIRNTLARADEPVEALAYHLIHYGRPKAYAVKRGIADAFVELVNEYTAHKYDSAGANVRMGDVIELCHPRPRAQWQSELFQYLLDRRHGRDNPRIGENMGRTQQLIQWRLNPTTAWLPELVTWENMSSYMPMDAAAWEAVIPSMGYMALLRNLRNFEQAGVAPHILDRVATHLADPDAVAMSRQLPFRFYSAYENVYTDRFRFPLGEALEHAVSNIPYFPGDTLVLVDTSGSMSWYHARPDRGQPPVVQAALFGSCVAQRSEHASFWIYADNCALCHLSGSVLRNVEQVKRSIGAVGHGTNTWESLRFALSNIQTRPQRVFIFTDMQSHPETSHVNSLLPRSVPVHVWDLGGYGRANIELGSGRYLHAGLSDQSFKTVRMLEELQPGRWPWEA